ATAFTLNKANQTLLDILNIQHADRTFDNTLLKIDDLYNDVSKTWNIIGLFSSVHPSASIRKEADKNDLLIQDYMFQLSMRKDLYRAVLQYSKKGKALNLKGERKRFLDGELRDFERSGLGLSEDDRRELRKIQNRLSEIIIDFSNNINSNADTIFIPEILTAGLPDGYKMRHKQNDGLYAIDLSYPSFYTFMENAHSDSLRKLIRLKFLNIGYPDNLKLLDEIIIKRD
ncbi:uncharacterized protein METZ01_LOCUS515908, partial [marine metagenome]